jgi:diguanylate cyclase (GGDEF)-like protein
VRTLSLPRALLLLGSALVLPITHLFWEPDPETPFAVGTAMAVLLTAARIAEPIYHLARKAGHDELTGLVNRRQLADRLALALAALPDDGTSRVGLVFCDLDHFKVVNDSLGHLAGDQLLIAIADRLRDTAGPADVVCRLGGDEFVILMPCVSESRATETAERISAALRRPLHLADGTDFFATMSLGLRTTADPDADPETLLQDADTAMYQAKAAGRGRMVCFDEQSRTDAADRLRLDAEFRRALTVPGEVYCDYQPVFRTAGMALVSVEALVRWRHPVEGVISPARFVPVAEATGTVADLFTVVLRQSLADQRDWHARTGRWIPVAVNLSPRQLDATTTQVVLQELTAGPNPAHALTLELTETESATPELVEAALGPLRQIGVRIAVDDFGTGYSSMARIADHGWDVVKIDRSLVHGVADNTSRRSLVGATVAMARALNMTVVAEGVDNDDDLTVIRNLGCDFVQGFLLSRPVDATVILNLAQRAGARPEHPVG